MFSDRSCIFSFGTILAINLSICAFAVVLARTAAAAALSPSTLSACSAFCFPVSSACTSVASIGFDRRTDAFECLGDEAVCRTERFVASRIPHLLCADFFAPLARRKNILQRQRKFIQRPFELFLFDNWRRLRAGTRPALNPRTNLYINSSESSKIRHFARTAHVYGGRKQLAVLADGTQTTFGVKYSGCSLSEPNNSSRVKYCRVPFSQYSSTLVIFDGAPCLSRKTD